MTAARPACAAEPEQHDPRRTRVPRLRRGALRAMLAAAVVVGGCNVVGPIAYFIGGPGTVKAQYVLEERPTVVYVDDRASVIDTNARALRLAIAQQVTTELMVHKALAPELMIDARDAMGAVIAKDRASELMAIDEIGRSVGAEVIIYLEMLAFAVSPDGVTPRPTAACQVRVIDVTNRVRLFPPADGGEQARRVNAVLPEMDPTAFRTLASRSKVFEVLASELGDSVARVFYSYEAGDLGGRLEPPK